MDGKITLIPGDGIGPEIVREAKKVLDKVGEVYAVSYTHLDVYKRQEEHEWQISDTAGV